MLTVLAVAAVIVLAAVVYAACRIAGAADEAQAKWEARHAHR